MDIKITGITEEIMHVALNQAKDGRLHILGEMAKALTGARAELGEHAPRIEQIKIPTDKIREVIGSGGKVIREIVEKTGAKIDIADDGTIKVASPDGESIRAALKWIKSIVAEPEVGEIYDGKVVKVMDFGAFVNFFGPRDGLVHISELAPRRVAKVTDVVKEGDIVKVKLVGFDDRGKVRLSMKVVDQATGKEIVPEKHDDKPRARRWPAADGCVGEDAIMIDLTKGGGFDLPEPELEEHWLFAICVAGKRSDITNRKLDRFLRMLPTVGSPFEKIRAAIQEQALGRYLREGKLGPYDRIQRAFEASVAINLRTCMVEDLEEIPGVGPKTSRLFILSTRPNVEYAIPRHTFSSFLPNITLEYRAARPRTAANTGSGSVPFSNSRKSSTSTRANLICNNGVAVRDQFNGLLRRSLECGFRYTGN